MLMALSPAVPEYGLPHGNKKNVCEMNIDEKPPNGMINLVAE